MMDSTTRLCGRIGTSALRLAALALVLLGVVAQPAHGKPAHVTPMDKGAFKAGCESAGGSYVESALDDTFRCNLRGGGSIICHDTTSPCIYQAKISNTTVKQGLAAGSLKIISPPATMKPKSKR